MNRVGYYFGHPNAARGPAELLSYSIFSVSVKPVRILSPRLDPGDGVSGPFIDLVSEAEVEGGTDGLL